MGKVRIGRWEGGGAGCGSSRMQGEAWLRTSNILSNSVTLVVSKLSGWLKSSAPCRVARKGMRSRARWEPGGERAVSGGYASRMQGRARQEVRARGGGARLEHSFHIGDQGRVEV